LIIGSFIHVKGIYLFSLHLTSLSPPHRIGEEEVSCCKNKVKYAKLKKTGANVQLELKTRTVMQLALKKLGTK
jgi:hypothetical protein